MRLSFDKKRLLFFAGRINTFLFFWVLALLLLFTLSNYQRFLDVDQRLVMNLLAVSLLLHPATGLFFLIFSAFQKDSAVAPRPGRTAFIIVAMAVFLVFFLVLQFFYVWIS